MYAGSISSSISKRIDKLHLGKFDANEAIRLLSVFDCENDLKLIEKNTPTTAVFNNLISRGQPTFASPYVESVLAKRLNLTERKESVIENINFDFQSSVNLSLHSDVTIALRRSLVSIEPRLSEEDLVSLQTWEKYLGSKFELQFFYNILPDISGVYARQLVEPQRPIQTILRLTGKKQLNLKESLADLAKDFFRPRVDFAFEFPTTDGNKQGLVAEIDGIQHNRPPQSILDKRRDKAVLKAGWLPTIRIKTMEYLAIPAEKINRLKSLFEHEYAQIAAKNYDEPFWLNDLSQRIFQLVLVPIAVARIQKVLVQFIQSGVLRLDAEQWEIAIHERDVPCAWLAVEDFLQLLSNLLQLQGKEFKPKVQVRAYCSKEFVNAEFGESEPNISFVYQRENAGFRGEFAYGLDEFDADVMLDVAVLQTKGFTTIEQSLKERVAPNAKTAVIRSVHSIHDDRIIATSETISYQLNSQEKEDALQYFLQSIFRKKTFLEGQVEILKQSLARQDVIGLLPTGGGKSLCYQLSALLQPGITLVIDPLKSLMSDQNDNLIAAGIDSTVFINSTLSTQERIENIRRFKLGHFQFAFISPERLLIKEFRDALTDMSNSSPPKWFAYCVVDEVHCVSEWGHDFRTAYLGLGDNARKFCSTASGDLTIIALTGTASFDVLSDVQRELKIYDDQAIVMPETYERDELKFKILSVPKPELPEKILQKANKKQSIKKSVAGQKKVFLVQWLKNIGEQFETESSRDTNFFELQDEQTNSGLIFCPHVGWVFGIKEVAAYIRQKIPKLAEHVGVFGSKLEEDEDTPNLQEIQRKYKRNELSLLVATKSFGMGIDKPNIRYTVHFNMPPSIEAFYQEAGRAGRDRDKAVCVLLFMDDINLDGKKRFVDKDLMLSFHRNSFKGTEKEKRLLYELLNQIEFPNGSVSPGIENILESMANGESRVIVVGFENDQLGRITNLLRREVNKDFDEDIVRDACYWCYDVEEFIKKLKGKFMQRFNQWPADYGVIDNLEPQLKKNFMRIRSEQDTFKAIYRLSLVGIISDYTLDYNTKTINATIKKRSDEEYIDELQNYISRYVSREEARQIPEVINSHRGKSTLQKCIGYLIDFVYERIAQKRREAIDIMEEAARIGANGGDFGSYVNTYFDSRYTPKLREYIRDYTMDIVWKYIEEVNGEFDLANHLLGACNRLLAENPENAAFLLLRAYARFVIDNFSNNEAISDFKQGFEQLENRGMDWESLILASSKFHKLIEEQNRTALLSIEITISQLHLKWLKRFNERFLEGM